MDFDNEKHLPASIFHNFFENPTFHARRSAQFIGFPAKSFAQFRRSMTPPERIRIISNTGDANERVHFEKI